MTLNTLTQREPWMTPQEHDLNQNLIHALASCLENAGVPQNPLVALRVNDIASTWLLTRRLESALTPTESEAPPCPTPAQADAIGKCRERLRKAIKELEEYGAKNGPPAPQGLVEKMHEAVRLVRAAGISTNNFTRVIQSDNQETENNAPETPDDPSPEYNAPETPDNPSPEYNTPETPDRPNPQYNAPKPPGSPYPQYNAPKPPGSPYPQYNAPETPDEPNPEYTAPEIPGRPGPENNTPGEHRKSRTESRDKYRPRNAPRPAQPATRSNYAAIDIPYGPPRRKPPRDTG